MKPPEIYTVLDFETTGLPTDMRREGYQDFNKQRNADHPVYITEIGAATFRRGLLKPIQEISRLVSLPRDVKIPQEVVNLNGITTEECNTQGINILEAIKTLMVVISRDNLDCIVTHNGYRFDGQLLAMMTGPLTPPLHDTKLIWTAKVTGNQRGPYENFSHFHGRIQHRVKDIQSSLSFLYELFNPFKEGVVQTHRALADVHMTNSIFKRFTHPSIWNKVFAQKD